LNSATIRPSFPESEIQSEEAIKNKEQKILQLGQELKDKGKANELGELIKSTRPFLNVLSKAKAAKLVRELVEMFLDMDAGTGFEVELCQVNIFYFSLKAQRRIFPVERSI
jgi:hypothetical protein